MIKIMILSYFDSGDGLEPIRKTYKAKTWTEMIKILIDHHADAPVLPTEINIEYL